MTNKNYNEEVKNFAKTATEQNFKQHVENYYENKFNNKAFTQGYLIFLSAYTTTFLAIKSYFMAIKQNTYLKTNSLLIPAGLTAYLSANLALKYADHAKSKEKGLSKYTENSDEYVNMLYKYRCCSLEFKNQSECTEIKLNYSECIDYY